MFENKHALVFWDETLSKPMICRFERLPGSDIDDCDSSMCLQSSEEFFDCPFESLIDRQTVLFIEHNVDSVESVYNDIYVQIEVTYDDDLSAADFVREQVEGGKRQDDSNALYLMCLEKFEEEKGEDTSECSYKYLGQ